MNFIFLLISLFISSRSFAQAPRDMVMDPEGKYGEERSYGDMKAADARAKFELAICQTSIKVFCPFIQANLIDSIASCLSEQKSCGAAQTNVETRVIAKYGDGKKSAHRDLVPAVAKVMILIREIQVDLSAGGSGVTDRVNKRVNYISTISQISPETVLEKLKLFFSKLNGPPPSLNVDYWGYFQQGTPQRHKINFDSSGRVESIQLAFRWCGTKFRFVPEVDHITGDLLALAIFSPKQLPGLQGAKAYNQECESFSSEVLSPAEYD